jgi:hypothetical protein
MLASGVPDLGSRPRVQTMKSEGPAKHPRRVSPRSKSAVDLQQLSPTRTSAPPDRMCLYVETGPAGPESSPLYATALARLDLSPR